MRNRQTPAIRFECLRLSRAINQPFWQTPGILVRPERGLRWTILRETLLVEVCLFLYDRRAVGPNTAGAIDAVGAGDGPRWWRTFANDGSTIGPETSGAVDAAGAGDRVSRRRHSQGHEGREAKRGDRQRESMFHT
jgi:hypothetical protein